MYRVVDNRISWRATFLCGTLIVALIGCSSKDIDPDDLPAELVSFKQTLKVKTVWSRGIGGGTKNLRLALRPAEDGVKIYAAAHNGTIAAMDLATGHVIWKANTKLPISAGPSTDGNLVVAGSSNGDIVALDAATGAVLWTVAVTSEVLAPPLLVPGKVIVRAVNGKLSALDAQSGEQLWSIQQSVPRLSVRGTSAPVVARNMVICGFDNGRVSAIDLSDGGVVWDVLLNPPSGRTSIERLVDINAMVHVAGGDVYAVGYQGSLGAIAIESGQLLWSRDMSSDSGFAVDFNSIYVANQRSELVALSRASGRELWLRTDLRNRDLQAPAVFGGSVVAGDDQGYLHWFDVSTGELQARIRAGSDRITSQPLVVNDILYVMNDGGTLYAFRVEPEKKRGG